MTRMRRFLASAVTLALSFGLMSTLPAQASTRIPCPMNPGAEQVYKGNGTIMCEEVYSYSGSYTFYTTSLASQVDLLAIEAIVIGAGGAGVSSPDGLDAAAGGAGEVKRVAQASLSLTSNITLSVGAGGTGDGANTTLTQGALTVTAAGGKAGTFPGGIATGGASGNNNAGATRAGGGSGGAATGNMGGTGTVVSTLAPNPAMSLFGNSTRCVAGGGSHSKNTGVAETSDWNVPVVDCEGGYFGGDGTNRSPALGGGGASYVLDAGGTVMGLGMYGGAGAVIIRYAYTAPAEAPTQFTDTSIATIAAVGDTYSSDVAADGSPAPTYTVDSGALPDGLTLDSATGAITGTPSATGKFTFTIKATNSAGNITTNSLTILIVGAGSIQGCLIDGVKNKTATLAYGASPVSYAITYTAGSTGSVAHYAYFVPALEATPLTSGTWDWATDLDLYKDPNVLTLSTPAVSYLTSPPYGSPWDPSGKVQEWRFYDEDGNESFCSLTITQGTAPDTTAPTITGPSAPVDTTAPSTAVTTLSANESVTWSVTGGTDADLFQVNASGVVAFKSAPTAGTYSVTITATDGAGNTKDITISVVVAAADTTKPTVSGATAPSVTAPSTTVGTYTADETVTWQIAGGANQALFQINPAGVLSFKSASSIGTYYVQITATDTAGNISNAYTITVTVVAPVDVTAPTVSGSTTPSVTAPSTTVGTYTANETATWQIAGGANQALFQINSSGVLSFRAAPTAGTYYVQITATDTAGNISNAYTITVTVVAAPDTTAPTVTGSPSVSVTAPSTAVATYSANETVTWTISGGANQALFQINSSGVLSFRAASTAGTYVVQITATDTAGNPTSKTVTVTVSAPAPDTTAPTVTGVSAVTATVGTTAVTTLTANETVTWTISGGANASLFQVNASGVVTFRAAAVAGSYTVIVTATDAAGNATAKTIVVTVPSTDTTAPTVTGSTTPSITAGTTTVATFTASETSTWSITGGTNQALFSISASGVLSFRTAAVAGTYAVIVTATDAAGNTMNVPVTVTVTAAGTPAGTATMNADGTFTLSFTGVTGTPTVSVSSQSKPAGVTYSNGKLTVTDESFSGTTTVELTVVSNGVTSKVAVTLTVTPKAPTALTAATTAPTTVKINTIYSGTTKLSWTASKNATGYRVVVDGVTMGTTAATSYTVNSILGPKNVIEILALGNDNTVGTPVKPELGKQTTKIGNINFASGKPVLTAAAKAQLDKLVTMITRSGLTSVTLGGHTDGLGKRNDALALARAAAVKSYLAGKLAGQNVTITTQSYGSRKPVASNSTTAGRALNRRVDIGLTW